MCTALGSVLCTYTCVFPCTYNYEWYTLYRQSCWEIIFGHCSEHWDQVWRGSTGTPSVSRTISPNVTRWAIHKFLRVKYHMYMYNVMVCYCTVSWFQGLESTQMWNVGRKRCPVYQCDSIRCPHFRASWSHAYTCTCRPRVYSISFFWWQSITKFESLANQVQKNAGDIEERLHMIENVRLFKQPPPRPGCDLMDAKVSKLMYMHMLGSGRWSYTLFTSMLCTVVLWYMYIHVLGNHENSPPPPPPPRSIFKRVCLK